MPRPDDLPHDSAPTRPGNPIMDNNRRPISNDDAEALLSGTDPGPGHEDLTQVLGGLRRTSSRAAQVRPQLGEFVATPRPARPTWTRSHRCRLLRR